MRILVDENIPRMTVDRLRELGHDVKDIRGTGDKGLADADLWDLAVGSAAC
jgi:predicted nuclease of predicted toxin-antitoxin system